MMDTLCQLFDAILKLRHSYDRAYLIIISYNQLHILGTVFVVDTVKKVYVTP